jgi:hypothetical protein
MKIEKYYLIVFDLFNLRKKLIRETKSFLFFKNDGDSFIYRVSKKGYKVKCIAENYEFWTKTAITVINDHY